MQGRTIMNGERLRELVNRFDRKQITLEELLQDLTPDEARAAAHYAGFNTDDEIHARVREGWANLSQVGRKSADKEGSNPRTQAGPTLSREIIKTVMVSDGRAIRRYELIGEKIVRYKVGP